MSETKPYEAMTPAELRKEADRRDLVAKAKRVAERRYALDEIAGIVLAIPKETVTTASARMVLMSLLAELVKLDDDGEHVTNGDVNLASIGTDHSWWDEATADHPAIDFMNGPLARVRARRNLPW